MPKRTSTFSPGDRLGMTEKDRRPDEPPVENLFKLYVGATRRRRRKGPYIVRDQYPQIAPPSIVHRQRLPNRRAAVTFDFNVGTHQYTATAGYFIDGPLAGKLAEIFLSNSKAGSALDAAARDSAVLCSLALQHGADIETLRRALMRDSQGIASSPLGAALDLLAQGPRP
jgi:hypothetical protein